MLCINVTISDYNYPAFFQLLI